MLKLRIQKEMTERYSPQGVGDDLSHQHFNQTGMGCLTHGLQLSNKDSLASPRTTGTRVQGLLTYFFCAVRDNIT